MIVRFGCWLVLLAVCSVALADIEVSTEEMGLDNNNNTFVDNVPLRSDFCYCGLHSKSCSYVEGKKKCICYDSYADNQGICEDCDCGYHAEYENECEFDNRGKKTCNCREGYAELEGDCQECDCGDHGKCILFSWGKTCRCEDGYAYADKYGTCEVCNCGDYGSCSFSLGIKKCSCFSGFAENIFGKCQVCNCGEHFRCSFESTYGFNNKKCTCEEGYALKSEVCTPCDCGGNARCTFDEGEKQCDCNQGFAENDRGKCEECDCQMDDSNCTIDGGQKKCQCPEGFEPSKDYPNPVCIDKDECLSPEDNDCDPLSTKCVNTRGSYDCVCREGFQIIYNNSGKYDTKKDGCKDIDECWDESPCIHLHTRCVNTPGSYRCECTDGYSLEKDSYAEKYNYCSENARPWKTASIVVGCLFGFVSLGLLIAICNRHCAL